MLSSKTGRSLNMAGHYPGGHKRSKRVVTQSERTVSFVYPKFGTSARRVRTTRSEGPDGGESRAL
jgi:hypothetical protein